MTDRIETPGCSLVVEWENTRHVETARTRAMLQALAQQLAAALLSRPRPFELLVAFNPEQAQAAAIRQLLIEQGPAWPHNVSVRLVALPAGSYYALKNQAAALAQHELVVFIDCDVLPQPDWLAHILAPFDDPCIGVSQGVTYVEPMGRWSGALALAWLFPLRLADGSLSESGKVIANNIAFRRRVLLQHPYPDLPTWRGQCSAQRRQLEAAGVGIHWAAGARSIHPFPEGPLGTLERAFLNGHDHLTRYELAGGARGDWRASYWRFSSFLRRAESRRQQLLADGAPWAASRWLCRSVAMAYWAGALFSECMLHLAPRWWRSLLQDLPRSPANAVSAATEQRLS